MGRTAYGVRGINLDDDDYVVGMVALNRSGSLLVVSEKGMGKRSPLDDYRVTNRGGKGVITLRCTEKTGKMVTMKEVVEEDEMILTTVQGLIIRIALSGVKVIGRNTSGVKLINLGEGDRVIDVARIIPTEDDDQQEGIDDQRGQEVE
jgi:DNA gyrase subunit A